MKKGGFSYDMCNLILQTTVVSHIKLITKKVNNSGQKSRLCSQEYHPLYAIRQ